MDSMSYVLTFIEGILTFISPCILPMLPIYFMYLAGDKTKNDNKILDKKTSMLANSLGFVLGFTLVYVFLGSIFALLGNSLTIQSELLRKLSGAIMIVFGLNFVGILNLKFLNYEKRINFKVHKLGFTKSIVFGMVFGFGWTPCIGAFLGSALILASSANTVGQGFLLLLVYSIGLGIPFIITSIIIDKLKDAFKIIQKYSKYITITSGIFLIIAGILIITNTLKYFNF